MSPTSWLLAVDMEAAACLVLIALANVFTAEVLAIPSQKQLYKKGDLPLMLAPAFTPFDENFQLKLDVVPEYADYLKKMGINGVLVGGTTGEGMSMSVSERKKLTQSWVDATKGTNQSLMVQVGGAPLVDVKAMANHAESLGVAAILSLPELYYKPTTINQVVDYLRIIGEAAPKTPLFYYHNPKHTGVYLDMAELINEGRKSIPTFAGIKFTHSDLDAGSKAIRAAGEDMTVFLGSNTIFTGAAVLGFKSSIANSLNMWPRILPDILTLVSENRITEAKALQDNLALKVASISKHGSWVSTMKPMMKIVTGLDMGPPRQPLKPLTEEQISQIKRETDLTYSSKI